MVLVTHGISSRRHVLLKSQSVTAPTLMLKHMVSTISATGKNSTVMFTLRKNRDVRLPPVANAQRAQPLDLIDMQDFFYQNGAKQIG